MKQKIKKAGHIAFHLMQSISTKVVLIILILVLPLNILAIVLSHAAIEAMTEQAALSVTSVMENYNTELLHRMELGQIARLAQQYQQRFEERA